MEVEDNDRITHQRREIMNSIFVVVGSDEHGNVWVVSAHTNYDDASNAKEAAEEGTDEETIFSIEETLLDPKS